MPLRTNRSTLASGAIVLAIAMSIIGCKPALPAHADAATLHEARSKGVAEANSARARGILLLKEYPPMPSPAEHGDYIKLLKEKCNCDYEVVPMQEFSKLLQAEVTAWNDTMMAEIKSKHGPAIFGELHAEARKRWEARTQPKEKK